jgi:hypothetical protein
MKTGRECKEACRRKRFNWWQMWESGLLLWLQYRPKSVIHNISIKYKVVQI